MRRMGRKLASNWDNGTAMVGEMVGGGRSNGIRHTISGV